MKAMVMKGMAAPATTAEQTLRPARDALRLFPEPQKRATSSPTTKPPEREAEDPNALESTIYRFILRHSLRQQLLLLLLTLVSFPFLYFSLDLPKTIVNRAIGSKQFPQDIFGFSFNQITYLLVLCAVFLILVFFNGAFKYYINTVKGRLGERMLRRLR